MADIFGREAGDYTTLQTVQRLGGPGSVKAFMRDSATAAGRVEHNFRALGSGYGTARMNDADSNAQAISYLTNNLQAIQAMIEEILYTEFRLDNHVPLNTMIPEGATTYAFRVVDRVGQGAWIETGGTDAPSATVAQRLVAYPIEYGGIIPEWTIEDLRRSLFGGVPLDTETIRAAITGAMNHIEMVGLVGDTTKGLQGLVNHSAVDVTAGVDLSGLADGQAIVDQLQSWTTDIITRSKEVFGLTIKNGLCIYLPIEQAALITNKRIKDGNDLSVWNYFVMNNAWYNYTGETIQLKWLQELENAATGGSTDRMIMGLKNDRIFEMAMPISPRVVSTLMKPFSVCAPIEYKISGINMKRPTGLRYYDGV